MKNKLLLFLAKIFRCFLPKRKNSLDRILVVSTTGLGDTLWATPALESLKKALPSCYLAVLTSRIGKEVLSQNPWIDEIFLLKEPLLKHLFSLFPRLFRKKFDTILLFHASQRLTLPMLYCLGASRLIGTKGRQKGLDALLSTALPDMFQHEIVRRLEIVKALDIPTSTTQLSFFGEKRKRRLDPKKTWIAIHPGAKDGFKRWPTSHFIQLCASLKKQTSCSIVLTGLPSERALMEKIAKTDEEILLAPKNLSLNDLASLLSEVKLLIANDTGPFHLSLSLQQPALAIYSPTDPNLCGPLQKNGISIFKPKCCTPCLKRKCKRPFCLLQIGPEEVLEKALQVLEPWKKSTSSY